MKQKLLFILTALLTSLTAWADVEINEENFPDEIFRSYLLSQDFGEDGVLTDDEIAKTKTLSIQSYNIQSLKGIECFTALEKLTCIDLGLTSLDVSGLTALWWLDCSCNLLTSLDVSKNTALRELWCSENQLTSFDVSKNTSLVFLACAYNQLTSLDVSKNTALSSLFCSFNPLTSLDVSKNTALRDLTCISNQLTSLDVSKNTKLTLLYCWNNQLTSIDVSGCTALETLACYNNQLTSLDVSKNTELMSLDCYYNQLTSLDLSKNTALQRLYCNGNQLTSIDLSNNTALVALDCFDNKIKDDAMDALVANLPTAVGAYTHAIDFEDEENVMTTTQVAAANAKGWKVYYRVTKDEWSWEEYAGSEPTGIDALTTDMQDGKYYDLQGHGIDGKPTEPGIYIVDGKKIVIGN